MIFSVEQLFAFAIAGVVVSLLLEYFPKLNTWFNGQQDNVQKLIVLGSGVLVVAGAFGLNCLDFFVNLPWACSWLGVKDVAASYIAFVLSSQGTYLITPKSNG